MTTNRKYKVQVLNNEGQWISFENLDWEQAAEATREAEKANQSIRVDEVVVSRHRLTRAEFYSREGES